MAPDARPGGVAARSLAPVARLPGPRHAVLTDDEKELGVALVDLGGGTGGMAMELGANAFLSGSVTLRERQVIEVQRPVLR